ncbi:sigma-54-dependent Fis family transcriptional regulator [Porphyromonas gingivalis]|uniref:sigma-54-dependent transcriptional regulator n=1 Tax=Porphyromonas gingivalis TaxID=837 RepID=UPI001F36AB3E|nr:sigma-54 dependent transcriptional regulator [Porphyromonas gingivalis]MCE8193697.1 sigma-54-dependent Fis family transcriptional regulator [Porphyromonas gingivalis]
MKKSGNIIVVDDNKHVLTALKLLLTGSFETVTLLPSPKTLLSMIVEVHADVLLLDMNFSTGINTGNEGLYWLDQVRSRFPDLPVVLFTAYADIRLAVEALKRGASDFVVKPWNNAELLESLRMAMNKAASTQVTATPKEDDSVFLGKSKAMREVLELADRIGDTAAHVLITGENGTGKGILAEYIHARSPRSRQPMLTVDMGALSETLFESELFGHVKGAFTDAKSDRAGKFETASGGTIFMDEIGNLSLALQAKLLAVLQQKVVTRVGSNTPIPVDVRIISATNSDLPLSVAEGRFREDLLYRLNTIHIEMPPLRRRREDIAPMAVFFLHRYARQYGKEVPELTPEAEALLSDYPWPGNVRELQHCIEKAVILSRSSSLSAADLSLPKSVDAHPTATGVASTPQTLDEMEKTAIEQALARNGSNLSNVARELGISRQTLYNKMKRYGL